MKIFRVFLAAVLCFGASVSVAQVSKSITSTQCASIGVDPSIAVIGIQVTGTWTGTLQPQGVIQGQTPFNVQTTPSTSSTAQSTITANGGYFVLVAGYSDFLLCGSTVASGTANVFLNISQATAGNGAGAGAASFPTLTGGTNNSSAFVCTGPCSLNVPTNAVPSDNSTQAASDAFVQSNSVKSLTATNLLAAYLMPATEVSTTVLSDYSGNANNGTFASAGAAPTRLSNGSISCVGSSSQFITLPAPLRSANTWMIAYSENIGDNFSGVNYAPMIGVSADAATFGLWQIGTQKGLGSIVSTSNINNYYVGPFGIIGEIAGTWGGGQGTHVLTTTHDVAFGKDRLFLDGTEVSRYVSQGLASTWNPTPALWEICGTQNSTLHGYFTGTIHLVGAWSSALSPYQVAQNSLAVQNLLAQKAVSLSNGGIGTNSTTPTLIIDGDSIAEGNSDTPTSVPNYPTAMVLNVLGQTINNGSSASQLTANELPNVLNTSCDSMGDNAGQNVVFSLGCRNDFVQGVPTAWIEGAAKQYCQAVRKCGGLCVAASCLDSAGDAAKNAYGLWMRQHWYEFADSFWDFAGDPNLGCDGCTGNGFYQDAVHPTHWANFNIMAPGIQRISNLLTGPKDFSRATVYGSAAPAAQTVTAATQNGTTNIATYTFTSNSFVAGQYMSCTGITPSGYNAINYTSLTLLSAVGGASGTVTALLNTSGLGAGTIFGSCTAPMQKEERYSILNFGAGSFTIIPCDMITGQRINIQNVNAATSTITAFGPDLIDGSATLSIAQNQVRILEATTITPAAPVCSWTVIQ